MAFLRAAGSSNHHDLGLMAVGANAPRPPRGSTGCTTWRGRSRRSRIWRARRRSWRTWNALTGQSDHGATKSLYGVDPDENEFEVMWMVPRASGASTIGARSFSRSTCSAKSPSVRVAES